MYRRLIPMSHEQYLDEPGKVVQWMVRIDEIERAVERDRRAREMEELRSRLGF